MSWKLAVPMSLAAVLGLAGYGGRTLVERRRSIAAEVTEPHGDASIAFDSRRLQDANVRTAIVRRPGEPSCQTSGGVIRIDETRLFDVSLKVEAWIQELAVTRAGQQVKTGDTLATIYSPDLFALQSDDVVVSKTRDQILQAAPDGRQRAR